jgi:hypothetical protein
MLGGYGAWFQDEVEANEWLPFDAPSADVEAASYATPDHFWEWQQWRRQALDKGFFD